MNLGRTIKSIKKAIPLHNDEICMEIALWAVSENMNGMRNFLTKVDKWMHKIDKTIYDLSISDIKLIYTRYKKRYDYLVESGKRTDIIDRSLIEVYITDPILIDRVYFDMCISKTRGMVQVMKDSPELAMGGTFDGCMRHCNNDIEAATKRYKEICHRKGYSTRLEKYTDAGHDEVTARKLLTIRQTTFSLEKCIERYGDIDGKKRWEDRQFQWLNTLASKPAEEIALINSKKSKKCNDYIRKYGNAVGIQKYTEWVASRKKKILKTRGRFSGESLNFFADNVPDEIFVESFYGKSEFSILRENGKRYYYDFRYKNVILEYHGEVFHPNPKIVTKDTWVHAFKLFDYDTAVARDIDKREVAIANGFTFFELYSNDPADIKAETISQFLQALEIAKNLE